MEPTQPHIRPRLNLNSPGVLIALAVTALLAAIVGYIIVTSHAAGSSFVTRSGSQLMLNGSVFRFSGANLYWVGLDDNIRDSNGNPSYPTHYRIDNGFAAAQAMNATVARTHTIGISVGCSTCLEPTLGTFNDAAFESIDYAVESAAKHNIKLMVPLIDEWRYYHGGKWTFVHWAAQAGVSGVTDTNPDMSQNAGNSSGAGSEKEREEQFYTNATIQSYYHAYLTHLLDHVNQYTGIALKDDPTIMAWETGNELFDAPTSWTDSDAAYLKSTIGVKQLVADGSSAGGNHDSNGAVTSTNIDILGDHFYDYPSGLDTSWLATDAQVAHDNNKAYIVGEYAWSRSEAPAFRSAIESNPEVSGDMLWAILPREEDGTPEPHGSTTFGDDDVALYYPTTSQTMQTDFTALAQHGLVMNGTAATPSPTPTPTPVPTPTPLPTPGSSITLDDTATGNPGFVYTGSWSTSTGTAKYNGDDHYTASGGNSATFTFTGSRAQIYGTKDNYYGITSFSIDGGAATNADLYNSSRLEQVVLFDTGVLTAKTHTITILNTGNKNASGSGTTLSIDAAAYVPGGTSSTPTPTPAPTATPTPTPAPTPTATPTVRVGDINADGVVNAVDLSLLLSHWGTNTSAADINHDGKVNVTDLSLLLSHWG